MALSLWIGVVAMALPREAATWVVAVADLVALEDRAGGLSRGSCGLVAVVCIMAADAGWRGNRLRG